MLYSIFSFLLLNSGLLHYFYKLKKNQTPKNPVVLKFSMLIGSLLALWAISSLFTDHTSTVNSVVIIVLAVYVLLTSITFTVFLTTKATPIGNIKVSVGDQMLPFKTADFDSESLMGTRTLLKFYRGSWCPYCSAELVMFEQLKPKLAEFGVQIVAISNETTAQQKAHLVRDNISHALISDADLAIIRQYGVEHHKAIGATADDTISMFGIAMPLPWKMKHRSMSIPTSLLLDESGKIVWIDQSEDYRLRASEDAVMGAVRANFDKKALNH